MAEQVDGGADMEVLGSVLLLHCRGRAKGDDGDVFDVLCRDFTNPLGCDAAGGLLIGSFNGEGGFVRSQV